MATIDSGYAVIPLTGKPGNSYSCFIRYSIYADGTDFTDTPTPETKYIGFYTGPLTSAPEDKTNYTWSQYAGDEMLIKYGPSNVPYETSVDTLEFDDDSLYELDDGDNLIIGEYGEWHDTPLPGDRYVIMSNDNGISWSSPMKIAADSLEIQYSPDGVQDWGSIFRASDKYMRQRVGEDSEWSLPIKIVGEDAVVAPVYECELSMAAVGSEVKLKVYKDGEVCTDTVYYEDFYGTGNSGATEEGPTGEITNGTVTITGGTGRNKHLIKIYSDSNKTELLVTGFCSYGSDGTSGSDSVSYWLIEEAAAIKKSAAGVFTPATINLNAKKKQGIQGVTDYAGRLKVWKTEIAEPTERDWTQLYASASNESTMTNPITIQSTFKAIKCELYFEGGFTTLLDQDIIPIVDDGEKGDKGDDGTPLNNRGIWLPNTAYAVLDCVYVESEKTSYFCKTAHTSDSTFSSTNWTILGAQGNPGQNATQYYIHFVYNDSDTTADNYSKTEPRKYIGVYTDTNTEDADTFAEATLRGAVWSQSEPDELMRMYSASSVPPFGLYELDDGDNLILDDDAALEIETGGEWHSQRQEGDIYCIESTDGGKTWSDPLLLTEVVKESYEKYAVSDDGITAKFWRYDRPEVPAGSWLLIKKITIYEGGNSDEVIIPTYSPADALSLQTSADSLNYSLRRDGLANYQEFTVQASVLIEDEKQPLTAYSADASSASGITATVNYDAENKIATFTFKTASGGEVPKGYVTISITTGGVIATFSKQITISATKSGKYLGLATALTDTTATIDGIDFPASIGDFVTWGGTESETRKQTYNYQLIQTGVSSVSWSEYTDDSDTMTSLSDIMSLVDDATNKNTKAVLLVQRLVVAEEFLHNLFVNKIKLITEGNKIGAIYGGKYDKNGNVDPEAATEDKGVYLDANGEFKASNGQFEGEINSESGKIGGIGITESGIKSDNYEKKELAIHIRYSLNGETGNLTEVPPSSGDFHIIVLDNDNNILYDKPCYANVYVPIATYFEINDYYRNNFVKITNETYPTDSMLTAKFIYFKYTSQNNTPAYNDFICHKKNEGFFYLQKDGNMSLQNIELSLTCYPGNTPLARFAVSKINMTTNDKLTCYISCAFDGIIHVKVTVVNYLQDVPLGITSEINIGGIPYKVGDSSIRSKTIHCNIPCSGCEIQYIPSLNYNDSMTVMIVEVGCDADIDTFLYDNLVERIKVQTDLYDDVTWDMKFSSKGTCSANAIKLINQSYSGTDGNYSTFSQPIFSQRVTSSDNNANSVAELNTVTLTPAGTSQAFITGLSGSNGSWNGPTRMLSIYYGNKNQSTTGFLNQIYIMLEGVWSKRDIVE